jgi:Ca2+-transporting ATPase
LITDSFPALSLGVDKGDADVMKKKPRNPKDSIFKGSIFSVIFNGCLIGFITLVGFVYGVKMYGNNSITLSNVINHKEVLIHAQTISFTILSLSQAVHALNMRSRDKSIFKIGLFTNMYLIYSIIFAIVVQFAVIYIKPIADIFNVVALDMQELLFVIIMCLMPLIVNEIKKLVRNHIK